MESFTPVEYLKIDVASSYGLDKKSWQDRIAWFDNNQDELFMLADLLKTNKTEAIKHPIMKKAESPALLAAGLFACREIAAGKPCGYPISLDATASGAQIMAVLSGCEQSASFCNVIPTGNREDFYTNCYQEMLFQLDKDAKVTRQQLKESIMPWFYGSSNEPKKIFGEGELLDAFLQTMQQAAPGVSDLRDVLINLWQSDALSHNWILPDNFHVKIAVMAPVQETVFFMDEPFVVDTKENAPMERGISIPANLVHSIDAMVVREISRRCSYDADRIMALIQLLREPTSYAPLPVKRPQDELVETLWDHYLETGFLSARILELLDEDNICLVEKGTIADLVMTLPDKPFQVLSVHDCFRVHPNYGNDLRRTYNQILHELAKSDILAFLVKQIVGRPVHITKYGDISQDVLQANYALS